MKGAERGAIQTALFTLPPLCFEMNVSGCLAVVSRVVGADWLPCFS